MIYHQFLCCEDKICLYFSSKYITIWYIINLVYIHFSYNGAVGYFVIRGSVDLAFLSVYFILCMGNDLRELYYLRAVAFERLLSWISGELRSYVYLVIKACKLRLLLN